MDKSQLKKEALESLSAAGSLLQEGDCQEAKRMAEHAWNCYYELQRMRGEDEDFTDLIYVARDLYMKCSRACEEAAQQPEPEPAADGEFSRAIKLLQRGEAGDAAAAMQAAEWLTDNSHWEQFPEGSIDDYIDKSIELLKKVANDADAQLRQRVDACRLLGRLFFAPLYGRTDMEAATNHYYNAARLLINHNNCDAELLDDTLCRATECAMLFGDINVAINLAQAARQYGLGMDAFAPIVAFGLRHNQETAPRLLEAMVNDGCREGRFLAMQRDIKEAMDIEDADEAMKQLEALRPGVEELKSYYAEHPDSQSGRAMLALAAYYEMLCEGIAILDMEIMSQLISSAPRGKDACLWANYYLARICSLCADYLEHKGTDCEPDFIRTLREDGAFSNAYYGAIEGHRECIEYLLQLLKATPDEHPHLLERMLEVAPKFDIEVDSPAAADEGSAHGEE